MATRIVIVEDDNTVRTRLVEIISEITRFQVVAHCENFSLGLEALKKFKPDILLCDLGLPDGSGIDIIKAIHKHNLDTQALVISGFQDEKLVFDALEAGAQGYILKQDSSQNISASLDQLLAGGSPISPVIARLMLQKFSHTKECSQSVLPEALTEKQVQILKYVSQGFSSMEIAEKLGISYHTVTTHIKNIYNKLQVNSRTEALFEAKKMGLI